MHNFFRTLAPEQFEAKVVVHADGNYDYAYDGVLIFVPALIQACRAGFLDSDVETGLKNAATQLRQEGFRQAKYLGRGRYAALLERTVARGKPSFFPSREMSVFSIRPQRDGGILISGSRPDSTAPCQLTGTDAEIDGLLTVTLEPGVLVLDHNAQRKVSTPEPFGSYQWRIKSPDADPFIEVRPVR
jgi:hypothetical protein